MEKDLIVIGGGPGGYVAAIRAAQLGAKVALIESHRLGGTCLNRGCIPTKALYKNAQMINLMAHADDFGFQLDGMHMDFSKAQSRKDQIVNKLIAGISQLVKSNGIEVIEGTGSFIDGKTIQVTGENGNRSTLTADKILICTGSVPARLPIPGIALPGVLTSDELLAAEKLPESIVVIGGGVIGIEFAGILNAMGTKVTVLEYMPSILPMMDADIVKRLTPSLKKRGINIETGMSVKEISQNEAGLAVTAEGSKGEIIVQCEKVLAATGRAINVKELNLDGAGIDYDGKGIKVDKTYETNRKGIYAAGDVIGGQMLAHVASEEGKAAVENMMGLQGHMNYKAVPACVFTFPEVACVGLTEEEAKAANIPYRTGKFMLGANGKALTMGEEEGFVKVLTSKDDGKLIGVHIMGVNASDLIHEAALAMENGLTVDHITRTIHAHPTLSEAFLEAVAGAEGKAIHAVPARR